MIYLIEKIRTYLISRSRKQKAMLLALSDITILNLNFAFALLVLVFFYSENYESLSRSFPLLGLYFLSFELSEIILVTFFSCSVIGFLNGYKSLFRSVNVNDLIGGARTFGVMTSSILLFLIYGLKTGNFFESFKFSLNHLLFLIFYTLILRSIAYRFVTNRTSINHIPILIYGAGQAGRETAASLSQNEKYEVIGFIDDDKKLKNFSILGFKVLGNLHSIAKIKNNNHKLLVIMAMVNISTKDRRRIISALERDEVKVKTIPINYGSLETKLSIENISIGDLIDRQTSKLDSLLIKKNILGQNILITGAGGSIGSEITNIVASLEPKKIICIDSSEYNLYRLKENFKSYKNIHNMDFVLRDIRNTENIDAILKKEKINTFYHAAAYKHVPILETDDNFIAALENNFFATFDLCKIASKNKVKNFTLISTDKAVNPTNVMGASKRLAELSLQAFQKKLENETCFSIVRFGNVLNSSGSVVPLFWNQILSGGPVTVTHEDVNRFFMTIEEASSLVIQANAMSEGGEVFLLDMGNPIKIKNLAERMIRLSGNSVAKDDKDNGIKIIYSGLRPGEKLYEEILLSNDPLETSHPKIKKGIEKYFELEKVINLKNQLRIYCEESNLKKANSLISNFVEGYNK